MQIKKPFFSIIIPTLNEEKFLPQLLQNLQNQKQQNFEIIIVDGSSTDHTQQKALEFGRTLPLLFLQGSKQNVSHQRNFGATKARGKYLIFLDADNRVYSNFTLKTYQYINKHKGLLFLPYIVPDKQTPRNKVVFRLVNLFIEASQNTNRPFAPGCSIIIEKHIFKLIGGFDEKLFIAEDHELVQRAHVWGIKAKSMPEAKVKFSMRRMKKEGELTVLYKYLVASAHILLKGKIENKIFEYKMGGEEYQKPQNAPNPIYSQQLKKHLKQINTFFKRVL